MSFSESSTRRSSDPVTVAEDTNNPFEQFWWKAQSMASGHSDDLEHGNSESQSSQSKPSELLQASETRE